MNAGAKRMKLVWRVIAVDVLKQEVRELEQQRDAARAELGQYQRMEAGHA